MFKIVIFFATAISIVLVQGSGRTGCDQDEIQKIFTRFEEFRQRHFVKNPNSIELYSSSVDGDIVTKKVKIDGGELTENYKINPTNSDIETIDGQLIVDVTATRYQRTDDGFEIKFSTRNGRDIKFTTKVKNMDLLNEDDFAGSEKGIVRRLIAARTAMFNFLLELHGDDRVVSLQVRPSEDGNFQQAEYVETGDNRLAVAQDDPGKCVGVMYFGEQCDHAQIDIKVNNGVVKVVGEH